MMQMMQQLTGINFILYFGMLSLNPTLLPGPVTNPCIRRRLLSVSRYHQQPVPYRPHYHSLQWLVLL